MTRRRQTPRPALVAATVASLLAALAPVATAIAANPVEVSFASTGAEQHWAVPSGVTSIHVVLVGGRGGGATGGGQSDVVSGDLAVTPGVTLWVEVGGNGGGVTGSSEAGGFNGGGAGGPGLNSNGAGGGGASDIRTVSRSDPGTLESRLIVAGGGGGHGGGTGGSGGGAGSSGADTTYGTITFQGGGGATIAAGGNGGGTGTGAGAAGVLGIGGAGGGVIPGTERGGGGGGGGYYGGGGGSGASFTGGAGGGGGSSFAGAATNSLILLNIEGLEPSITITFTPNDGPPDPTPGPDTGIVDATISMASSVCIELSTAAVDFGTGQFGQIGVLGSPDIVVTNCGASPQALFAHGTDATAPGASWTLVTGTATCADTLGLDAYHLALLDTVTQDDSWGLGLTNTLLGTIDVGSTASYGPTIDTACPGSTGAGAQMAMQIVFTAAESQP